MMMAIIILRIILLKSLDWLITKTILMVLGDGGVGGTDASDDPDIAQNHYCMVPL